MTAAVVVLGVLNLAAVIMVAISVAGFHQQLRICHERHAAGPLPSWWVYHLLLPWQRDRPRQRSAS